MRTEIMHILQRKTRNPTSNRNKSNKPRIPASDENAEKNQPRKNKTLENQHRLARARKRNEKTSTIESERTEKQSESETHLSNLAGKSTAEREREGENSEVEKMGSKRNNPSKRETNQLRFRRARSVERGERESNAVRRVYIYRENVVLVDQKGGWVRLTVVGLS